jgi:hypothetical protein
MAIFRLLSSTILIFALSAVSFKTLIRSRSINRGVLLDDDRVEIDPPSEGEIHSFYFDLRPTHLGEGEIWVILRQGTIPLLTLSIKTKILENLGQVREASAAVTSPRSRVDGAVYDIPSLSPIPHQLRISEQRNGSTITYRYDIESASLGILDTSFSNEINIDHREDYIKSLYTKIETRWHNVRNDRGEFLEELRAFGGELLDELIPSKLKSILWKYRSALKSIMVFSEEPFIPWELVVCQG